MEEFGGVMVGMSGEMGVKITRNAFGSCRKRGHKIGRFFTLISVLDFVNGLKY